MIDKMKELTLKEKQELWMLLTLESNHRHYSGNVESSKQLDEIKAKLHIENYPEDPVLKWIDVDAGTKFQFLHDIKHTPESNIVYLKLTDGFAVRIQDANTNSLTGQPFLSTGTTYPIVIVN